MSRLAQLLHINPIQMHSRTYEYTVGHATSHSWINVIFLHSMLACSSSAFSARFVIDPLSSTLCNQLHHNVRCYVVDIRNHGESPHSKQFCLESICVDLNEFIHRHQLQDSNLFLVGHSLGGKASLLYSLLCGSEIAGIVALDASPSKYQHNHQRVFHAMKQIDFTQTHNKHDVAKQLRRNGIADASEIGFILGNLNEKEWKWKCNLNVIAENEHKIHSFPNTKYMSIYERYALFIGGTQGTDRLTNEQYVSDLNHYFPNNRIALLDGGHFIHRTHFHEVEQEIVQYFQTVLLDV